MILSIIESERKFEIMDFNMGSLLWAFCGALLAFGASWFIDKGDKKDSMGEEVSAIQDSRIVELQTEISGNKETLAKVAEVHAYARKLEEQIMQLESTSDSADSQLRVKVLEKQLSDKADLESKLAVALQQLEDYKAKAAMFDSVVTTEAAKKVAIPAATKSETKVEPAMAPKEIPQPEKPKAAPIQESIAAVAAIAQPATEMKVVENERSEIRIPSPVGSTAPAREERPALRVESNPIVEIKDPLEKIDGIGQVYQTKLYEAGIKTFAQLAASSPSRITEIVEPQNWQTIDIMKWRREAALFAAGEKV